MISDGKLKANFLGMIVLSGCMGIIITLGVLLVCTLCSPIAVNIVGVIKDVFLTYAGFAFFDGVHASFPVLVGLGLSFTGATLYSAD